MLLAGYHVLSILIYIEHLYIIDIYISTHSSASGQNLDVQNCFSSMSHNAQWISPKTNITTYLHNHNYPERSKSLLMITCGDDVVMLVRQSDPSQLLMRFGKSPW